MNTIMIILSIFMLVLTIVTAIFAFWSIKSKAYMPYRKKLADFEEENKKNLVALVHFEIGLQDFEEKNYEKSIEEYTKAIELRPDYAEAYNNRGNTYFDLKSYDNAMIDYSKAIELKPDYAEAYNNRGNVYRVLKIYGQAINDYEKAIELCEEGNGVFRTLKLTIGDQGIIDVSIVEVKGDSIKRKKVLLECIKDSFGAMMALGTISTETIKQNQNKKKFS